MEREEVIRVEDFTYVYPGFSNHALDEINVSICRNEFVAVIGCNKAGKSTLCLGIVGVIPHSLGGSYAGTVTVLGEEINEITSQTVSQHVGIVFQDAESQFTQETVEDEIAFPLTNMGIPQEEMVERVRYAATECHLMDMLDRNPFKLSGGQQQRLAIASILALKPEIIILDESTSQLDPIGRDEIFTLVSDLHKEGHTIIMVDHNMEKVAQYAQKVIVMYEGKAVLSGTPQEVFAQKELLHSYNIRLPQVCDISIQLEEKVPYETLPTNTQEGIRHFEKTGKAVEV